jgi:TolC family type I secretion outer membrane protein
MINSLKYTALIFVLLTLLLGAGCQTIQAPSSHYESWNSPEREKILQASDPVWASIRKKRVDPSRPLDLVQLIDIALTNNPSTHQAWEEARAAEAVKKQAESAYYPQMTVSATGTRQKTVTYPKTGDVSRLTYGPSSELTYLLLDFGGRGAAVEEAAQALVAANFQFNQTMQDLLLDVETSYYGLYTSQSNLNAAKSDLKNARAVYKASRQRFEAGLVSKLDVLQAKSNYEDAGYSLGEAQEQLQSAKAALAQVLGLSADTKIAIAAPDKQLPTDITDKDISKLIDEALGRRPDINSLRASLKSKEAGVRSATSDMFPSLNFGNTADKNWHRNYGPATMRTRDYGYTAYLSVTWNIFDGFNNLNKRRQAQAEAAAQADNLKQAELQASTDVWNKFYAYKSAVKKFKYSRTFYETSKASFDLATESYNAGLKSMLDLLQAQSDLSEAKSKLIQSREDLFVGLAELAHATGSLTADNKSFTRK